VESKKILKICSYVRAVHTARTYVRTYGRSFLTAVRTARTYGRTYGPSIRISRTYGPYVPAVQVFPDAKQCLFGKFYALHDVTYDIVEK